MGFTADLLGGLAQLLDDHDVGTWKASGKYAPADRRPIVISAVPSGPDEVIVLTSYDVDNDATQNDDVIGVQVRTRGTRDPRVVDLLDDDVFDVLQGLDVTDLSTGVRVALVERRSSAPIGADENGRHERSSNYYVTAHRPSSNRL